MAEEEVITPLAARPQSAYSLFTVGLPSRTLLAVSLISKWERGLRLAGWRARGDFRAGAARTRGGVGHVAPERGLGFPHRSPTPSWEGRGGGGSYFSIGGVGAARRLQQ